MAELLLALDLGTTGVRALVVDAGGEVRSRAYRPLGTAFPRPGWVEQDPSEMWARGVDVMREALGAPGVAAGDLAAIGVVTQRATVVAWDAATDEPLAPAIGWQDQRTAGRVAELQATGIPISTLASATKLEWWMRSVPAVERAAAEGRLRLGTPDAWLTYKLCGAYVTDPSHASCTALFDLAGNAWSPALCNLFAVPLAALPRIVATSAVVGDTPSDLLGVPVRVAARAGDQQAAAFGQGMHAPGDAKLTLGTSAMLDRHAGSSVPPFAEGAFPLSLWQLSDGTRAFCREASVVTAGAALDWLVSLGLAEDVGQLEGMAGQVDSSEGAVFVPALQGLGTPFLDDGARGLIGGLTRGTGARHVARAALEGVAERCADLIEALGAGEAPLHVDGGLARSDLLVQLIADLGGVPVLRARETETTALGAAQLAGLAVGLLDSPAACRATLPPPARFDPVLAAEDRAERRAAWLAAVERTLS